MYNWLRTVRARAQSRYQDLLSGLSNIVNRLSRNVVTLGQFAYCPARSVRIQNLDRDLCSLFTCDIIPSCAHWSSPWALVFSKPIVAQDDQWAICQANLNHAQ